MIPTNIEGIMKLESHQWILKLVGECLMMNRIFTSSQMISLKITYHPINLIIPSLFFF